jgi:hypothetical protein
LNQAIRVSSLRGAIIAGASLFSICCPWSDNYRAAAKINDPLALTTTIGTSSLERSAIGGADPRHAKTAAPNKIQFNGVDGLRTYVNYALIDDQPSPGSHEVAGW